MVSDANGNFDINENYRSQGGTFIVTVPSVTGGDAAKNVIGLELTGYRDSSGNKSTPGISINLGDG